MNVFILDLRHVQSWRDTRRFTRTPDHKSENCVMQHSRLSECTEPLPLHPGTAPSPCPLCEATFKAKWVRPLPSRTGYSIWDPEGGAMDNFADPLPYFIIFPPPSPRIFLASCTSGPVTAYGVDLLTEIYVIQMETPTSHPAIARCFGSRTLPVLAPCQPHWQPANPGKPIWRRPPVVI